MEKDSLPPPVDPLEELTAIYKKAGLTEREIEIVNQLYQGYTNRIIAENLFITENTLKSHLKKIYPKFGVRRKSELISKLANRSFPEPPSN
jgi:DNA-binding CsgD family transcriptional regulator